MRKLKLHNNMLTGIHGYWDGISYQRFQLRRRGARVPVKGEELVMTPEQKHLDKQIRAIKEQRKAVAQFRRQEQYGKNAEAIRGTGGFHPNSGIHTWILRWEHEPELAGLGDGVGVASSSSEAGGPCEPPLIGGLYDEGSSFALYANGNLVHGGSVITTAVRKVPRTLQPEGAEGTKLDAAGEGKRKRQEKGSAGEDRDSGNSALKNVAQDDESSEDDENGADDDEKEAEEEEAESDSQYNYSKDDNKDVDEDHTTEDRKTIALESAEEIEEIEAVGGGEGDKRNSKDAAKSKKGVKATESLAALWGKGSLVTCIFDTQGGGMMNFEVDGERLDAQVCNVFTLLGAEEIYPCICLFPLDPKDAVDEEAASAKEEEEDEEDEEDEDDEDEDAETDEDEDDEDEAEESKKAIEKGEHKTKKQKDMEELAKATKLDVSIIMAMSREKREELRESVIAALAASRKARVTIVSPVPPAVVQDEANADAQHDKTLVDESVEQEKAENEEDEGKEEEEEEDEEVKNKKLAADESGQPLDKVRWMWEQSSGQWEVYSGEISREIELARRAGHLEHTIRLAEITILCKISGGPAETVQERSDETQRLRRHVIKDGIFGMLEMMSVIYKPPLNLNGEPCLQMLQKVWSGHETLSGKECGLGFIFIYCLLQGQTRSKVLSSGFSDWWLSDSAFGMGGLGGGRMGHATASSANDSHRLGLLLTQLLVDAKTKSVFASVLNVMGRNKQLSVRFPEFRDTRKNRSSNVFNAWTDDKEPRSAVADLFNKLIPLMQGMKKSKHAPFVFPPKSLGAEMPAPPSTYKLVPGAGGVDTHSFSADLSDLDCQERILRPIAQQDIQQVALATQRTEWRSSVTASARHLERLPLHVEDEIHLEEVIKSNKDTLFVLVFHAAWCGTCRALHPLVRKLAMRTPAARFLRLDVDAIFRLALRLEIKRLPAIRIIRPAGNTPVTKAHVLGSITEVDEGFVPSLMRLIQSASTPEEVARMHETPESGSEEHVAEMLSAAEVGAQDLATLSSLPLEELMPYVSWETTNLPTKAPTLDVSGHAAAQSAVAKSMLKRMKDDVVQHLANESPTPKLRCLSAEVLQQVFSVADDSDARRSMTQKCVHQVEELLEKLQRMRAQDTDAIQGISLLSNTVVNYIDLAAGGFEGRLARSKFVLRRAASTAAYVWPEFLFAAILSSRGEEDIRRLNPYLPRMHVETVVQLVMLGMLRANRLGHLSRCIGATVVLLQLLRGALDAPPAQASLPKFVQAADDVASIIAAGRHFTSAVPPAGAPDCLSSAREMAVRLDPRFLIFEFTWNILLRKKQVDIVCDFVAQVKSGNSKVKQMIMGAGKTTVVAPLLALMLADSSSLVLSVVPKALLEMSRTQMRETFANIITKRISTFKFERSTVPHEGMRLNLENSVRNRGIVVATPTSIKSVMLVYIETLRNLHECW
jgi:thiol-disulfide isomerase/thioredoxin